MTGPAVGQACPPFSAVDMNGTTVTDRELWAHGPLVLYFYPKDNTTGCTAESCAFRDDHAAFRAAGASVVGVSPDSPESHRGFAQSHNLPFRLLSDPDKTLFRLFGVASTLGLFAGRETFVIDKTGTVQHRFRSQLLARKHVVESLSVVRRLAAQVPLRPDR